MDFKFSKDSGESQEQETPGEKKSQSALLVLLLILVGGFTYIYFFTNLIKPQDAVQTTTVIPQTTKPQIVKMPLPTREAVPAKPPSTAAEKAETQKTAVAPAVKSAPAKPLPAPAPKPAPAPPKVAVSTATKPDNKNTQPVAVANKNLVKAPAAAKVDAKKTGTAAEKPAPANTKKPLVKETHKKSTPAVKTKGTPTESWSLIVGNYVLEETLSADMAHVRKAGFQPTIKTAARKKSPMNRLFVSESSDLASERKTLARLKQHTSDAFIIEQGGKFAVYAGSYLQSESADAEKERLKAAGFTVTVKRTDIEIPSRSLSIGPFKSKKAALSAIGKLKKTGIKATLSQK